MAISVEYLAIFRRTDSFCDSVPSFTRLLGVDSNISLNNGTILFQGHPTCSFQISGGTVADKKQRYFQLRFTWEGDPATVPVDMDRFLNLLKAVRGVLAQADGEVETLWDDVSGYYARAAYPLIHEVENLMRRLIANFMLVNVGLEWASESLPSGVEEAVRKSKRKDAGDDGAAKSKSRDYLNVLHTLDFIHLGDLLFNPYSKKTVQDLYAKLKDAKTAQDVRALQDFIPQSNWKRYFQKLVDCDDSYLDTRWKKLYELRCKVAHNAIMTGRDLDETRKLIDEVRPKLLDAIKKLSNVTVPPEDAELVAENAARSLNAAVGEFIGLWQQLEAAVTRRAALFGGRCSAVYTGQELVRLGILDPLQVDTYDNIRRLRNQLVHDPATNVGVETIQRGVVEVRGILQAVDCNDFVQRLREMDASARDNEIDMIIANTNQEVMDSEEFASEMANTNATAFDVDDYEVAGVTFEPEECVVRLSYSASGEHDEDKAFGGDRITGSAELVIDCSGYVSYRNVTAEVDPGGFDDDPDVDSN